MFREGLSTGLRPPPSLNVETRIPHSSAKQGETPDEHSTYKDWAQASSACFSSVCRNPWPRQGSGQPWNPLVGPRRLFSRCADEDEHFVSTFLFRSDACCVWAELSCQYCPALRCESTDSSGPRENRRCRWSLKFVSSWRRSGRKSRSTFVFPLPLVLKVSGQSYRQLHFFWLRLCVYRGP